MNGKELHFNALNNSKLWDVVPEYLYYNIIIKKYKNIDFTQYKELMPNGDEVISINNFHKCMLEQDEEYKNYVIEDVLYDIDRYGYYAVDVIEEAIGVVTGLLTSEFTPDTLGNDEWDALLFINEKRDEKHMDKFKRQRKYKK